MKKKNLIITSDDYVTSITAASIGGLSCALFPLAWTFTLFVFIHLRYDARSGDRRRFVISRSQNLGHLRARRMRNRGDDKPRPLHSDV